MSTLGTLPLPALSLEGTVADESTPSAPLRSQVVGDGAMTAPPAEAGARGSQQQQMLMVGTGPHRQTQQAYGKMVAPAAPAAPAAPRYEEHRNEVDGDNKEDEDEEGDDEVGEDNHLGAHTPDNRPWSRKEDDAITRMVRVCRLDCTLDNTAYGDPLSGFIILLCSTRVLDDPDPTTTTRLDTTLNTL